MFAPPSCVVKSFSARSSKRVAKGGADAEKMSGIMDLSALAGRNVFDVSVSGPPPATSEGPGPLRRKQKQNVFKRFSGFWALKKGIFQGVSVTDQQVDRSTEVYTCQNMSAHDKSGPDPSRHIRP